MGNDPANNVDPNGGLAALSVGKIIFAGFVGGAIAEIGYILAISSDNCGNAVTGALGDAAIGVESSMN